MNSRTSRSVSTTSEIQGPYGGVYVMPGAQDGELTGVRLHCNVGYDHPSQKLTGAPLDSADAGVRSVGR